MTQRYEIEAWLGDEWTSEQIDTITERIERWERTHPSPSQAEVDATWIAIAEQVDGVLDLEKRAETYSRARLCEVDARDALRAAVWVAVTYGDMSDDMSESAAARIAGVDRMTIRAWLGKR